MPSSVGGLWETFCCHPLRHAVTIFVPKVQYQGDITHHIDLLPLFGILTPSGARMRSFIKRSYVTDSNIWPFSDGPDEMGDE
jgi:hypothetical protein